jgi:hypothetical protein
MKGFFGIMSKYHLNNVKGRLYLSDVGRCEYYNGIRCNEYGI